MYNFFVDNDISNVLQGTLKQYNVDDYLPPPPPLQTKIKEYEEVNSQKPAPITMLNLSDLWNDWYCCLVYKILNDIQINRRKQGRQHP